MATFRLNPNARPFEVKHYTGEVPWIVDELQVDLSLSEEMILFSEFIGLSTTERLSRDKAIAMIEKSIEETLPNESKLTLYGSYASNTSVRTSFIDVMIECYSDDGAHEYQQQQFLESLSRYSVIESTVQSDDELFTQIKFKSVTVNISLRRDISSAMQVIRSNQITSSYLKACPAVRHVQAVVRHVLTQACSSSLDVLKGGLSPTALLTMVIHIYNVYKIEDPGELLTTFLHYFSSPKFDYVRSSVAIAGCKPKLTSDQIFVEDPVNFDNNLASECIMLREIKAHFASMCIALRQHRGTHTKLSTIISHRPLWSRRAELADIKAQEEQMRSQKYQFEWSLPVPEDLNNFSFNSILNSSTPRTRTDSHTRSSSPWSDTDMLASIVLTATEL